MNIQTWQEVVEANKEYDLIYWPYTMHVVYEIPLQEISVALGPPMSEFIDKHLVQTNIGTIR